MHQKCNNTKHRINRHYRKNAAVKIAKATKKQHIISMGKYQNFHCNTAIHTMRNSRPSPKSALIEMMPTVKRRELAPNMIDKKKRYQRIETLLHPLSIR